MAKIASDMVKTVAYLRTSSAANVGADRHSEQRQREAIQGFAARAEFEVVGEFYDAAVSGTDPIESRPGFMALLDHIEANGVRVVIVEDASRFARQLVVQEAGILALVERGVRVLTASGDDLTETDDPYKIAMRQIAGVFAQLEKARLVGKLRAARDRKRAMGLKVEGRKRIAEWEGGIAIVAAAKRLHRRSPKSGARRSLREIANELAREGHTTKHGRPFSPSVVKRMVEGERQ
nr:recombinase family protein [Methylobacterium sp. Leaf122]